MRWPRPEDRAETDVFCYICEEYTIAPNRKPVTSFLMRFLSMGTMLILVLNLLTRIKPGRHTWCARRGPGLSVGGPMARGIWTLEFPWFGGSRQTLSLTATFYAVDVTGVNRKNRGSLKYPNLQSARRPVAHCDEISVPIFGNLPDISDEDASSVEEHEDEEQVVLEDDAPHPFSQKELNDLVRGLSLSTDSAELLASRLKEKILLSDNARISFFRNRYQEYLLCFLYSEGLGVLCRYCAASAQAWSATVRTQRLETVHWQQQAITAMCSATHRQPVCLCTHRSLDYTEGEVWSGEVCAGENWLWSA